jgi:DNA-binding MarR family transcriptional regulator
LDEREMRAWRNFVETVTDLMNDLDNDLSGHTSLSLGDYQVLVYLSEADGHSLRMCDLAERLHLSPSGLTRRLNSLVKAGLVTRIPSDEDRRVTHAHLTPEGLEVLRAAAPIHVASVRARLLDPLSGDQIDALGDIFETLRASQLASHIGCDSAPTTTAN